MAEDVVRVRGLRMDVGDDVTLVADAWHPAGVARPNGRRAVAGAAAAPAVRAIGGIDAGATPSGVVRPPRVRGGRAGLPGPRRLGRPFLAVRARGRRRCGGRRVGGAPAVLRRPGRHLRVLLPGAGPAVRRRTTTAEPAGHRPDDVLPRPVRGLDVRGRAAAVAVRVLLGGAARGPGSGDGAGPVRPRRVAALGRAGPEPAAVVR